MLSPVISNRSGSLNAAGSRLAAAVLANTIVPAGMQTPRQLEVFGGDARQGEADRSVAHGFPHRVRNEFELIEQRPLVGIIAEKVHAAGRWWPVVSVPVPSRATASDSSSSCSSFSPVVFAADQLGDQVVGQRAAPASDHVLEVVAEGLKGVEDAGLVGGEIPVKALLRTNDLPRVRWKWLQDKPVVLVRPDRLDQQAVVEPVVLRLTADHRRINSMPTES
jgi:hypothetical protein